MTTVGNPGIGLLDYVLRHLRAIKHREKRRYSLEDPTCLTIAGGQDRTKGVSI